MKQQLTTAPPAQAKSIENTAGDWNTERESLQKQVQSLKESGMKVTQYARTCQKEIARLRAENAQLKQGGTVQKEDMDETTKQQIQDGMAQAQQQYDRIVGEAQAKEAASVLRLTAEQDAVNVLVAQKDQLEMQMQTLLQKISASETFLQHTNSMIANAYQEWERDSH